VQRLALKGNVVVGLVLQPSDLGFVGLVSMGRKRDTNGEV
jgi:hypothetical protein